ncbi:hypothetical protein V8B97DRAFT_139677 [Scleroderma yunnanense]
MTGIDIMKAQAGRTLFAITYPLDVPSRRWNVPLVNMERGFSGLSTSSMSVLSRNKKLRLRLSPLLNHRWKEEKRCPFGTSTEAKCKERKRTITTPANVVTATPSFQDSDCLTADDIWIGARVDGYPGETRTWCADYRRPSLWRIIECRRQLCGRRRFNRYSCRCFPSCSTFSIRLPTHHRRDCPFVVLSTEFDRGSATYRFAQQHSSTLPSYILFACPRPAQGTRRNGCTTSIGDTPGTYCPLPQGAHGSSQKTKGQQ